MSEFRLAIISDLHCHACGENGKKESFLIVGDSRMPENKHPVSSLIKLVNDGGEDLLCDFLICCGDLSHQICVQGMNQAWDFIRTDLKYCLSSEEVICTIGNHDVSSRDGEGEKNRGPFYIARNIHPEFPFCEEKDRDCYWLHGFCLKIYDGIEFLIINTAHDHYDTRMAEKGRLSEECLSGIEKTLEEKSVGSHLKLAVLHHHPIQHTCIDDDNDDYLDNGGRLLDVLSKYGYVMVLHGHKHIPIIKRYNSGGSDIFVFGCGSFSRFLAEIGSVTRNLFHVIDLEYVESSSLKCAGRIRTWEFNYGHGWNKSTVRSAGIPHEIILGKEDVASVASQIVEYFKKENAEEIDEKEMMNIFNGIKYLLPLEIEVLKEDLRGKGIGVDFGAYGGIKSIFKLMHGDDE